MPASKIAKSSDDLQTLALLSEPRNGPSGLSLGVMTALLNRRPTLTEATGVACAQGLRQVLAGHLAGDQPAGRGRQGQADMLMAIAAIHIGEPRRTTDRWPEIGQGGPLADPAALLRATNTGEDILEMPHQQVSAMPGGRLVWRRQFAGAGDPEAFLHP